MFDSLRDGLASAMKSLRGHGKLTEGNMREGLKLVEQSLLEADVSYSVVQAFMGKVGERATGEKVLLSLRPTEQLVGIVNEELINILGPVDPSLKMSSKKKTTVFMLCGLQGSGKTTTCGKLTRLLMKDNITPMLVAADLQRPAAIEQLHVLGQQLGAPVYSEEGATDPVKVCKNAVAKATKDGQQVVILDTAGRLAIDAELMQQLKNIDRRVKPDQVFLVVDGMTGQDAVNSAQAFQDALELDGVIMTKLDGDTRGGALLSVKHVTGVPIKFIGTGEKLEALEPFRPEGMASRILGMGDMVGLVDMARTEIDQKEQEKIQARLEKGQFTLEDFKTQLKQMAKPGLMMRMIKMLPGGMGAMSEQLDPKDLSLMLGAIDSMTPAERRDPAIIDQSRRTRIAKGSGVQAPEIKKLVQMFDAMKPLITGLAGGGNRAQLMQQVQNMMQSGATGNGDINKPKMGTGKRLTPAQKKREKARREKLKRQMKRKKRGGGDA